jgi:putative two-component system response regulator
MLSDTPLALAPPSPGLRRTLIRSALCGIDRHWDIAPEDFRPGRDRDHVLAPLFAQTAAAMGDDARGHMARVGALARSIARRAGWSEAEADDVAVFGNLHDVGKVGIRAAVLDKPGPLTPGEEAEVRQHSSYGHSLLRRSSVPLLRQAAVVALQHHERWDGRGYPARLRAEEIDVRARIVSLADVYDALTSDRPYRQALTASTARDLMRGMRETHFDPVLFDLFESAWGDFGTSCS